MEHKRNGNRTVKMIAQTTPTLLRSVVFSLEEAVSSERQLLPAVKKRAKNASGLCKKTPGFNRLLFVS